MSNLFAHKAWANRELLAQVQSVDQSIHAEQRHACIRVLNHVLVVDQIFAAHLTGQPPAHAATNTVATPSLETLRTAVAEGDAWYLSYASTLAADQLEQNLSFTFTDGTHGRMTRAEMLLHIVTHGSYHRGAVGEILKRTALTPPRDILTRFLHDAEPARRLG